MKKDFEPLLTLSMLWWGGLLCAFEIMRVADTMSEHCLVMSTEDYNGCPLFESRVLEV